MLLQDSSHKHLYRVWKTVVSEEEAFAVYTASEQSHRAELPVIDMWAGFFKSLTGRSECLRFIPDRT